MDLSSAGWRVFGLWSRSGSKSDATATSLILFRFLEPVLRFGGSSEAEGGADGVEAEEACGEVGGGTLVAPSAFCACGAVVVAWNKCSNGGGNVEDGVSFAAALFSPEIVLEEPGNDLTLFRRPSFVGETARPPSDGKP